MKIRYKGRGPKSCNGLNTTRLEHDTSTKEHEPTKTWRWKTREGQTISLITTMRWIWKILTIVLRSSSISTLNPAMILKLIHDWDKNLRGVFKTIFHWQVDMWLKRKSERTRFRPTDYDHPYNALSSHISTMAACWSAGLGLSIHGCYPPRWVV